MSSEILSNLHECPMKRGASSNALEGFSKFYYGGQRRVNEKKGTLDAKPGHWHILSVFRFALLARLLCVQTRTCCGIETHIITISAQEACWWWRRERRWRLLLLRLWSEKGAGPGQLTGPSQCSAGSYMDFHFYQTIALCFNYFISINACWVKSKVQTF